MSEQAIIAKLHELMKNADVSSLKGIYKGRAVTSSEFKEVVSKWHGRDLPWPLIEPDLVLIFEDFSKVIDNVLIVAIETKYFEFSPQLDKRMREAFRQIGQPLRSHIFGFDSVILWHLFSKDLKEDIVRSYANVVNEVIEKLKLPVVYFATKIIEDDFKIYKPLDIEHYDISSVIQYLRKLCDSKRNPTLEDNEVRMRRSALKIALRIPS